MAKKSFDFKQERAKLTQDARRKSEEGLARATVDGEFRALSAEDKATVDAILDKVSSLDEVIAQLEALESAETNAGEEDRDDPAFSDERSKSRFSETRNGRKSAPSVLDPSGDFDRQRAKDIQGSKEYERAFRHFIETGDKNEYRDIIMGTQSQGGYLVTPVQISKNVVQQMNNYTFMRELCNVETVLTAQSLGVRQITTQPSDADWTGEIGNVPKDSAMVFARRDLNPNILTKGVGISLRMLESSPDVVDIVTDRIAYKMAVAEENGFLNGDGTGQALGVFTADDSGVPTSSDVVVSLTGAKTTITADLLIAAKYALKQQYLTGPKTGWIFHRVFMKQLRQLKDSYNRYLLVDGGGLAAGPLSLLDIPIYLSEYAPSTVTSGSYCGILGNFNYYQIAQVRDMTITRLNELYQATNEIGFIGRRWVDGSATLPEAFARLQLSS